MKLKLKKQIPSVIACALFIMATAFVITGCNGDTDNNKSANNTETVNTETSEPETSNSESSSPEISGTETPNSEGSDNSDVNVLGEGEISFDFAVTDSEGKETKFEIHTDKKTVGDALSELKLIEGEESEYGLYVKTVNGITVDYDKDGKYWAFYIDGEYAKTGVDSTEIKDGESYSFKVQV